jgi:hypothetical protein
MKDLIELKRCDLDIKEITDLVNSSDCGAISYFVGKNYSLILTNLDCNNFTYIK